MPSSSTAPESRSPVILWLREELRLSDNRALAAAVATGQPLLAIYVHDEESPGLRPPGGASRWWLHHALAALDASLRKAGGELLIFRGAAGELVARLAQAVGATHVFWSRRYGGAEREIDTAVKARLKSLGVGADSTNDRLLVEPWDVSTRSGAPFRVFTPFWRALRERGEPAPPVSGPRKLLQADVRFPRGLKSVELATLGLLPAKPDWAGGLRQTWVPGEAGARERLTRFIRTGLNGYAQGRDRPDHEATSRLSPHLHFGEISARAAWHAARQAADQAQASHADVEKFLSELVWREFSTHLLFHNPDLATRNLQARFDAFPWAKDRRHLEVWQGGRTGFPIIDAGMRQLWHTGWMHNRVRMLVASFLVKHLRIDWRVGEAWFWDTLVDADTANNAASWQWVAGSGADAAPYFRIFNPVRQGERFDPDGAYVRRWVPELANMPASDIHAPWEAKPEVFAAAKLQLGVDYPEPIIDLDEARARTLAAFEVTKK